jgi:hypothetical protein
MRQFWMWLWWPQGSVLLLGGLGQYAGSARKLGTPFCVVGSALITTSQVKKRWRKVVYKVRGTPSIWCGTLTFV